jgi:hypothetical protein
MTVLLHVVVFANFLYNFPSGKGVAAELRKRIDKGGKEE